MASTPATEIANGPGRRNVAEVTSVPNRIVEVSELSDEAMDELVAEADDYADENDGSLDVWGATEDGHEWRVRVIR